MDAEQKQNRLYIKKICFFFSFSFLITCPLAALYLGNGDQVFSDFLRIITLPSPLVTDYYQMGSMPAAFLNAGLCGLSCCILMKYLKSECRINILAGYFLVVAHCFYGLNFLNMWPPIMGIYLFCRYFRINFHDNLDMAMFSTAFGPFISELLFRYHVNDYYIVSKLQISFIGFVYMIIFSIFLGFAIPAMLPGALKLHRGFNLYNGGLAFGLLGLFIYAFMYKTMGIESIETYERYNSLYGSYEYSYQKFIMLYFFIVFGLLLIYGWYLNGKSFKGYGELMKSSGYRANFFAEYGAPRVFINIGFYGLMMLAYFSLVITFTDGAGFTGPTTGIILASITFSAQGQHPKNVWPILLGYIVLSGFVTGLCIISGLEIPWTLSTQGYMNGAAFATGLCPIAGKYGWKVGVFAGLMCAVMCTSTSAMHGGFVLYNGGLTCGITALILIPCLDYYYKGKLNEK